MKEIYIEYNPFTLELIVKEDGEKFDTESKIYEYINSRKRLQFWLDKLIIILYENINDTFNITFKGTILDYEDLQLEVEHFNKVNNTNITLVHEQVRSVYDRLKELKYLFSYMIDTAPFEELKEEKIIEQFNEDIGKEFELAVVATMSSGKSTLLNAFLGRELMPSKNQACTATIVRIRDVDGMEGASAICLDDKENVVINEVTDITVENMKEFNDNEKVSYIDIKTDIPFVSSHNFDVVLIDTPGPNNSRDERHKEKTYKVINESNALVLYVLNATQLSTNDDNLLLSSVLRAMEKAGKQAKDRFLFVVNKIDAFDLEAGDSIEKVREDVISYLKSHGIVNPNIYLVSAQTALITKLKKKNDKLSIKQEGDFEIIKSLFEEFDELHLSKYASLSNRGHDKINEMLKHAEDELDTLLVHSGVPAVEIAINDYLEKYVITEKIRKGVNIFIGYIKEKNIENNIAAALLENEMKLKKFNRRISDEVKLVDKYDGIYEKLNVLRGIIRNAESIENRVKEIKINKIWLDDFIDKVINIIEL
ncbi:dynamin family protein [Brachyspira innocens]|uniref:dynamin family protein n=1 Tax=Brachyspira innocens TaxID=13264 RepID=UPI0003621222|nr:dynamin family protein [Brachyspira innocens]